MPFEFLDKMDQVKTIATGCGIRDRARLRKQFGYGHWKKLRGVATIQLANGAARRAEFHWYEAYGIGQRKMKMKKFLD